MKRVALSTFVALMGSVAFAQFSTGFESPYTGSAGGTSLIGQQGWHQPAGSLPMNVYTYAGNTPGVVSNPTGGSQFAAGISGGTTFARGQHDMSFASSDVWSFSYDVLGMYTGTLPTAQNLGSFSSQLWDGVSTYNQAHASFNALNTWVDVATGAAWNAGYAVFDAAGAATATLSPGAAWNNLTPNHWYRQETRVNFATNQVVLVAITDLATSVTSTFAPTDWYLAGGSAGGLARPNGVRMFVGGATGNLMAFDNLSVVPEPASLIALGIGSLLVLKRRRASKA